MTRLADSSFLLALLHDGDEFHLRARAALTTNEAILIPGEVLTETLGVLLRRRGFDVTVKARDWIDRQNGFRFVYSAEREHRAAWRLFLEQAGRISLTDAVVVAWCRLEMAGLLTFDGAQQKALEPS